MQPDPIGLKGANQNHPESLNRYTYVLNDPINGVDPSGLLTLILGGFKSGDANWADRGTPFRQAIEATFNTEEDGDVEVWPWFEDGLVDLTILSLYEGVVFEGWNLASFINRYSFKEGEKLNIVAHSYGGNVVKAAMPYLNRQIDNLVTLGTPQNVDLAFLGIRTRPDKVKNHCNVSSLSDGVQFAGGGVTQLAAFAFLVHQSARWAAIGALAYHFGYYTAGHIAFGISASLAVSAFAVSLTTRIDFFANKNIFVNTGLHPIGSHTNLHTPSVWNEQVRGRCGL
jgi:hypothetical protein